MSRACLLGVLAALVVLPAATLAGPFKSKPRPDAARTRTLLETLKGDPDEKKRRAAADELGGADVRQFPEVATGLAVALQKDVSAGVRLEAAQSLGELDQAHPLAGAALEAAAAGDPSPLVRLAAKQTLWEYHLSGYRAPRALDGGLAQTVEPPIAAPGGTRPVVALIPAPPPPTAPLIPAIPNRPTAVLPPVAPPANPPAAKVPALGSGIGPRIFRSPLLAELMPARPAARPPSLPGPPPILNVTGEPPVAKRPAVTVPAVPQPISSAAPPPTVASPPRPLPPMPRAPDYVPTLPPFTPDLPSVVLPPDAAIPLQPLAPPKIPATLPPPK